MKSYKSIIFASGDIITEVKSIDMHHDSKIDPPQKCTSFNAQVIILKYQGHLSKGYRPVVDCHTSHTACKFKKLITKVERRTGIFIEVAPKMQKVETVTLFRIKTMCAE